MDIIFISGIFDFILFLATIIIIFSVQYVNGDNTLIFQFYEFYNIYGVWKMILTFLLGIIFYGFIIYLLEMKIVDILGPNFVYISYQIGKMPSILMSIEGYERWIVLALSILQIIFSLFYLEILEFNFCKLNYNLKKNIILRENQEKIIILKNLSSKCETNK